MKRPVVLVVCNMFLLVACTDQPAERVSLVIDEATVQPDESVEMTLAISGDVDDITYGGHYFLERATGEGWQREWVLFTHLGAETPTYSRWRKNQAFTLVGYVGEGSLYFKMPDKLVPGDYRLVFDYSDSSLPTDDPKRLVEITVPLRVEA